MRRLLAIGLAASWALAACSTDATSVEPGSVASTTQVAPPASWRFDEVEWPVPGARANLQGISLIDMKAGDANSRQLALAADDLDGRQQLLAWHSDDGLTWHPDDVQSAIGDETIQARTVAATAVDGDLVAAVGIADRLIDPHRPDGSGVHAEPGDVVGGVWWSTDAGATWRRTAARSASTFSTVAIVGRDIWIGGAIGSNSTLQAAVWRLRDGSLTRQGVFGEPGLYGGVSRITEEGGAVVADVLDVAAWDYSADRLRRVADGWQATGEHVSPPEYYASIDLGHGTTFTTNGQILHDGGLEIRQGSYLQHADLAYCFVDADTCKLDAVGFVVRHDGGPWQLLDAPDLGYAWTAPPPQIRDHQLVVYSAEPGGTPSRRATLDLEGELPVVTPDPNPPGLPAPVFDGTLTIDAPEAVEIGVGCGAEQLTINDELMGPVALSDTGLPDGTQVRHHGFGSDGPQYTVYGLLTLLADGTVTFTNGDRVRITTYEPTTPPEFMCG